MVSVAYIEFYDDQGAKIEGGVKITGREGNNRISIVYSLHEEIMFSNEIRSKFMQARLHSCFI